MRQSGGGGAAAGRRVYGACASGARCAALNFCFLFKKNEKISVYLLYWCKRQILTLRCVFFFWQLLDRMEVARIAPQVMKASVCVLL